VERKYFSTFSTRNVLLQAGPKGNDSRSQGGPVAKELNGNVLEEARGLKGCECTK
jgi:hypothetical protein